MSKQSETDLYKLIEKFHSAMLVTRTGEGQLRSRPMAVAGHTEAGPLYFGTDSESPKVDEIQYDAHANVSLQREKVFISISGNARITEDQTLRDKYWSLMMKAWFPAGKRSEDYALIEFIPTEAEYWDLTGAKNLRFLFDAGKAIVKGEHVQTDIGAETVDYGR